MSLRTLRRQAERSEKESDKTEVRKIWGLEKILKDLMERDILEGKPLRDFERRMI